MEQKVKESSSQHLINNFENKDGPIKPFYKENSIDDCFNTTQTFNSYFSVLKIAQPIFTPHCDKLVNLVFLFMFIVSSESGDFIQNTTMRVIFRSI